MKMAIKEKKEWLSFTENNQRWMLCKHCQSDYVEVSNDCAAVTCSGCVIRINITKFPDTLPKHSVKKTSGRPAGWHWMSEFVDKDGKVYHKGKEQPKLEGTLKPTKVKPMKKRKKLTADQKLFKRAADYKKRLKAKRAKV